MFHMSIIEQLKTKNILFVAMTCFLLICSNYLSIAESLNTTNINQVKNLASETSLNQIPVMPEMYASLAAQPGRYYVDGSVRTSGNGTSWATAFKTIHEAVAAVPDSSTIWVATGTYFVNSEPGNDPNGIVLDKMLYLFGGFTGREMSPDERSLSYNSTVLDAAQKGRCFIITKNVYLDGFTMKNGLANSYDSSGGAIKIIDCSPSLKHCVFTGNRMTCEGGAIYIENGSPYLQDCLFESNGSTRTQFAGFGYGGAIYVKNGYPTLLDCTFNYNGIVDFGSGGALYGSAHILRCRFYSNSCEWGGAGAISGGSLTIQQSTFIGNTAGYAGGAVCGNGNFIDCFFSNNISSDGGGALSIFGYFKKTNIVNCVFKNNTATNRLQYTYFGGGGAIGTNENTDTYVVNSLFVNNSAGNVFPLDGAAYANGGNSYILNCTFWNNTVNTIYYTGDKYTEGGTVYNQPGHSLKVANSILWNNHGSPVEISGGPADVSYCDLIQEDLVNINHNIQSDPLFIDPSKGNFHLQPDSPCSYAGSNLNAEPPIF